VTFLERLLDRLRVPRIMPQVPDPTDSPMPYQPVQKPPRDDRTYQVKEGDTLQKIARDVYGDEDYWNRIAEANRERIGDPPVLYPGLRLKLP
jgi:nucleoid-associated protein YgaU